MSYELCSENGFAEGQNDPDPSLIEVPSVPLETIGHGKNALQVEGDSIQRKI